MKKNIIFLSFSTLLFICGIFYPIVNLLSKDKEKDLQSLILQKAQTELKITVPHLNKSIQNSDDINLLSNIELIANSQNIVSCFILDTNRKVIIHNNTNEWNTEKHSTIYDKAIIQRKELIEEMPDNNFFLLSEPLGNDYTLIAIASVKKSKKLAKYWQIKYYSIASSVTIMITVILYLLLKFLILSPFNRIKKSIENNHVPVKDGKYNEIINIFTTERYKISKIIEVFKKDNECLIEIIEYAYETSIKDSLAFILLNSSNEILYYYDSTGKIIKHPINKNRQHILEAVKDPDIVKIVITANEQPGNRVSGEFKRYKISAISINKGNKIIATILKITEN
ncbi:MAG: hypothetical protein LBD61_03655 [Endomicrobium sp.]|jgi:hypothetical protein|nr:hypothetical protein [Endomicrobium sp.]